MDYSHYGYEKVYEVPPAKKSGRPRLILEPGTIVRRAIANKHCASTSALNRLFKDTGRADYHSCVRTIDSVCYQYIWRDAI